MHLKRALENLYSIYNTKEYLHSDPIQFLYHYSNAEDREITGLITACLAYGRVKQILRSVALVLKTMGGSPAAYVRKSSTLRIKKEFSDFRHRFANGAHMANLILGIKRIITTYGSLNSCFTAGQGENDKNILSALSYFAGQLSGNGEKSTGHLVPLPEKGSACKRLNLYLRWMVRKDSVDPGGWTSISPSKLIVPLDVHMHRIGRGLGFTNRKQADMKTALEITDGFGKIVPEDPVRYDFALTRPGILSDRDPESFLLKFGNP